MVAGLSEVVHDKLIDRHAFWAQTEEEFQTYLKKLKNTLGIVIISSGVEEDKRVITGLRDPLADEPQQIAKEIQLSENILENLVMRWRSYQDLTPEFVEKRAYHRLQPPKTAKLTVKGRILYIEGHASQAWIDKVATTSHLVAGIESVDTSALEETDQYLLNYAQQRLNPSETVQLSVKNAVLQVGGYSEEQEINRLKTQAQDLTGFTGIEIEQLVDMDKLIHHIENISINFGEDAELKRKDNLVILYRDVKQLLSLRQDVQIQMTGHTDGVGARAYNEHLSRQRAEFIYNKLIAQGLSSDYFIIVPPPIIRFGEKTPNFDERKVTFKILTRIEQAK